MRKTDELQLGLFSSGFLLMWISDPGWQDCNNKPQLPFLLFIYKGEFWEIGLTDILQRSRICSLQPSMDTEKKDVWATILLTRSPQLRVFCYCTLATKYRRICWHCVKPPKFTLPFYVWKLKTLRLWCCSGLPYWESVKMTVRRRIYLRK